MKVIGKSNFDNESVSDTLVMSNLTKDEAMELLARLEFGSKEDDRYYYVAVEDDYKLYEFEP